MTELSLLKDDVSQIKTLIQEKMIGYADLSPYEMDERALFIDTKFEEFQTLIREASSEILMWDKNQIAAAKKYIEQSNADMKKLEIQFHELQKRIQQREALLAGAHTNDGDGQELLSKNELNKGDKLIDELNYGVTQARDSGKNIIETLGNQRQKILDIDEGLTRLDTNIETGETIITRMICRAQRRKVFIWALIITLSIFIIIFLYFIIFA